MTSVPNCRFSHATTHIYYRKAFIEHCDIQIAIAYEMKLKIYFTSSFLYNLIEYIHVVGCVYIIYL